MNNRQIRLIDSFHFYEIALKNYHKVKEGCKIHRQNDALISLVFSAFALEAFINEILYLVKDAKESGENEAFFDKLIESIEVNFYETRRIRFII